MSAENTHSTKTADGHNAQLCRTRNQGGMARLRARPFLNYHQNLAQTRSTVCRTAAEKASAAQPVCVLTRNHFRRAPGLPAALPLAGSGRKIGVTCPRTLASLKGIEVAGGAGEVPNRNLPAINTRRRSFATGWFRCMLHDLEKRLAHLARSFLRSAPSEILRVKI